MALSSAPRALKVPVRWNSSSLRKTSLSGPSASETAAARQRCTGVSSIRSPRVSRAASIAARSGGSTVTDDTRPYSPEKRGARFSMNAVTASR